MKNIILSVLILTSLSLGNHLKSIATKPFNIDFTQAVTEEQLETIFGMPDTLKISQEIPEMQYIYSDKMAYYFVIKNNDFILYLIEVTDGEINGLKLGASKRKTIQFLGQPYEILNIKKHIIMRWTYMEKYDVMALFEKGKLKTIKLSKVF